MYSQFEIALPVIVVSIVMFIASLLFKDKEGEKPARFAFRLFYFFAMLFMIITLGNIHYHSPALEMLSIICVVMTNITLTIGILWRCKSNIPPSLVLYLTAIYLVTYFLATGHSVQVGYTYNTICSLICVYALLNRKEGRNTGDKGMAIVILVYAVLLIANLVSFIGLMEQGSYSQFMKVVFMFSPAYLAGLTLFLFSSYMLDAHQELEVQATTDPLTGLYNRRFFLQQSKNILKSAERKKEPACVMMCDIDYFKNINDRFGHTTGDNVLIAFAEVLNESLRAGDLLARYGGEEFVVLLPQTSKEKALHVAERMRHETEKLSLETGSDTVKLTASFGLCQVSEFQEIEISINQADKAMYSAKSAGRNIVKHYEHVLA